MAVHGLTKFLSASEEVRAISDALKRGHGKNVLCGATSSSKNALIASILDSAQKPALIISSSVREAERTLRELKILFKKTGGFPSQDDVVLFPQWDTIPYEKLSPSKNIIGDRLEVLQKLSDGRKTIVVAPIKAVVSLVIPPKVLAASCFVIHKGSVAEIRSIAQKLVSIGYRRADIVGERGEFAVRGGILDVFPATGLHPVRVDFLGDEVEAIKYFDVRSQRSVMEVEELNVPPAREAVITAASLERIKKIKAEDEDIERLLNFEYFEGMEYYTPLLYPGFPTLLDYFDEGTAVLLDDEIQTRLSVRNLMDEADKIKSGEEKPYLSLEDLEKKIGGRVFLDVSSLSYVEEGKGVFKIDFAPAPSFVVNREAAIGEVRRGNNVLIISKQPHRVVEILAEDGIPAAFADDLPVLPTSGVVATEGELYEGFKNERMKLLVLTDREIFGERFMKESAKPSVPEGVDSSLLVELKGGDFVVHENYGIGVYRGLERLTIDGTEQEYVLIEYEGEDKLYVPLSQMGLISKYSSSGDFAPKINRLGGREWGRQKKKAMKSLEDLTAELLDIYAAREVLEGFSYPPDSPWAAELEAAFPYEETPDQRKAIEDVRRDMESPRPMDRLLCGDVGYGKTEVALRAAFKAATAGKQVAVLVPTTILAEQHYNNFKERFRPFPVAVEMLSRFRSKEEQVEMIERLASGHIDVIIGTHRLLQRDVKFKDLGLLIIDEEQKFGVAHKEKLKKMKRTVDVLSLTATPIPRTLYMSLSGTRDLSMIATPPVDRSPITTYVMEWSKQIIREAILRELERGGQIYYIYNYVHDIEKIGDFIKELVPAARVAVAHGQMEEGRLEGTMAEFMSKKYDILLCTTIIESGIDIANVNTIIIDHASQFGLAQLYQLRGRVGRGAARACAYLLYRKEDLATGAAIERLQAIREFTALGSGYKLALRDLEIRGAGNVLGREQHGHMLALGFDLYCDLMEKAVERAKGIVEISPKEISIDIKVDAYIPSDYVADEKQRISYYRKLNLLTSQKEIEDMEDEVLDRFGNIPPAMQRLFNIIELKVAAKAAGIKKIEEREKTFYIEFFEPKRGVRSRSFNVGLSSAPAKLKALKEFIAGVQSS